MVRVAEHWSRLHREDVESSFLEIIQKLARQDPEKPAVADPALIIVGRVDTPKRTNLSCSVFL